MSENLESHTEVATGDSAVRARYVNEGSISTNVFDFVFTFRMKSIESTEDVAVLHMSPQHAVSILLLLERQVRAYEKQVGAINLPEELRARLASAEPSDEESAKP